MTPALLLAAGLLLAGCRSSASPPVSPTAGAATPTIRPLSTMPPVTTDPAAADAAQVRRRGFDPAPHIVQAPDGSGGTLYAIHGTCAGSADGYCQQMFFFLGTRYLGTDTPSASTAIAGYRAAGSGAIAVTYPTYANSDPLCCPSGTPVTITYRWNGKRLVPSGTPPGGR